MEALKESENRIMRRVQEQVEAIVQGQVKDMVSEQLAAAGFDENLTAAELSTRRSAMCTEPSQSEMTTTYAGMAASQAAPSGPWTQACAHPTSSKEDKQEAKFWLARRSLRLWPIQGGSREGLEDYLKSKSRLGQDFIDEDLGQVILTRPREPKNKNKDEYIVIFESKQIRDAVKAAAPNLANFRDAAGMRLHVPDHLQKSFQTLMNLSYDLKAKPAKLKRNVKFDEEDLDLYMDIRLSDGGEWKCVKPDQAAANNKRRGRKLNVGEDELRRLLGDTESE